MLWLDQVTTLRTVDMTVFWEFFIFSEIVKKIEEKGHNGLFSSIEVDSSCRQAIKAPWVFLK